jgi:hypothetical protein
MTGEDEIDDAGIDMGDDFLNEEDDDADLGLDDGFGEKE